MNCAFLETLVSIVFVFGFVIVIHEFGHFFAAKSLGVDVQEFVFGFGPRVLGKHFRDTEYVLRLLPLGGYVKMQDEEEEEEDGDHSHSFSHQPLGRRAIILLAGPFANFVGAFGLLVLLSLVSQEQATVLSSITWSIARLGSWLTMISETLIQLILGVGSLKELAGPITIVQVTAQHASAGLAALLGFHRPAEHKYWRL